MVFLIILITILRLVGVWIGGVDDSGSGCQERAAITLKRCRGSAWSLSRRCASASEVGRGTRGSSRNGTGYSSAGPAVRIHLPLLLMVVVLLAGCNTRRRLRLHAGRRGGRCAATRLGLAKSCSTDPLAVVTSVTSGSCGGRGGRWCTNMSERSEIEGLGRGRGTWIWIGGRDDIVFFFIF